jgi:F-type H+-transporting ATPase subunit b
MLLAAAALPVSASEGGGGGASTLLQPQIGTIFWTLVTFLCLAWLLSKFAWKPLLGALNERERSIQANIEQAERERGEANDLLAEHKDLVAQARRERAEALSAGQKDAERLKAEILDEARNQREQLLKQSEAQIQAGLRQARDELRTDAVDLALAAAEKLLTRNLDDQTHRKLVEEYLAGLESGGDAGSLPS